MNKKDQIEIIPIAITSLIALYSIIMVLRTNYAFSAHQYIGIPMVLVNLVLFFISRKSYRYAFGSTLFLGLFGLISFTVSIVIFNFFIVPIQLIIIPILILFILINKQQIITTIQSLFGATGKHISVQSHSKVAGFKRRFGKLNNNEIEDELNEPLIPEAHMALRQIIAERKKRK